MLRSYSKFRMLSVVRGHSTGSRRPTVGEIRVYPVSRGSFDRLYADDVIRLLSVSVYEPEHETVECVSIYMPLHALAPFVHYRVRDQIFRMFSWPLRTMTTSASREYIAESCCSDMCFWLYATFHRPPNSIVNPFHIDCLAAPEVAMRCLHPEVLDPQDGRFPVPAIEERSAMFPLDPLTLLQQATMVNEWCESVSRDSLCESACGCCGCLSCSSQLHMLPLTSALLMPLLVTDSGATSMSHCILLVCPAMVTPGEDGTPCVAVCPACVAPLKKGRVPANALRNGRWLGEVPTCFCDLTFMEKLLVACYRHNPCIICVDMHAPYKMKANTIMFSQPVAKLIPKHTPTGSVLNTEWCFEVAVA